MKHYYPAELAAKVDAVNRCNQVAQQALPILAEFFQQYIGQKIINADGSMSKRIRDKMPKIDHLFTGKHDRWFRNQSDYTVSFCLHCDELYEHPNGYHSSVYHEVSIYIGHLRDGILIDCNCQNRPEDFKTDYSAQAIIDTQAKIAQLKEQISQLKSQIHPFTY